MQLLSNEKILITVNGKQYSIKPDELSFKINGETTTLGTLLEISYANNKSIDALNKKLARYIEVEANAQKLIAGAHDSLALKLTEANDKISALEEDVASLKAKAGID